MDDKASFNDLSFVSVDGHLAKVHWLQRAVEMASNDGKKLIG